MVMDGQLKAIYRRMNGIKFDKEMVSDLPDRNPVNGNIPNQPFVGRNFMDFNLIDRPLISPHLNPREVDRPPGMNQESDLHEDCDFSDEVLKYINQMLMEENIEEKYCMFQESAALQAAEKSFYDALVAKDPPSHGHNLFPSLSHNVESHDDIDVSDYGYGIGSSSLSSQGLSCDVNGYDTVNVQNVSGRYDSQPRSLSSTSYSSSSGSVRDGFLDSPVSILSVSDSLCDSTAVNSLSKGFEEPCKLSLNRAGLFDDIVNKGLLGKKESEVEKQKENKYNFAGPRGKKNPHSNDFLLEDGRSSKQSAVFTESSVSLDMFSEVLLCGGGKNKEEHCEFKVQHQVQPKGPNGGKTRGKKQGVKKAVVDLRTLLTLCAQAVSANDRRSASELLKQIREHSSPSGDGMQRIAHYFSAGLEARMAGSGTEIYKALISLPTSAADVLKAYHLYLDCCPFRKISNFFSNKTIMHAAENKSKIHVIDFGILYGFQWPCFIQRLSKRPGGPPKLRITGIDFPCPGFRPSERVEETGRRLAAYAETFNVPFEFKAIAQKWETINIEDLDIDPDEMLAVNCVYRFRNLLDETVIVDSPRDNVLNLIRKMNPNVFVQGVINGAYNAPFFITRFREALFHFSSMFDMLEANVPREVPERMLIEKTIWGREAMNVIACEGGERIERPETYKQWQVRNLRAGFKQLPLNREIMKMAKERVKGYHKDFIIDEDGRWMLQGWKGRIIYALSSWKPAN